MNSVFDPKINADFIARIQQLRPDSTALWGKMTVDQVVLHMQVPIQVAFGEVKLKRGLIGLLFGGMAKKQLLKPEPFKHNQPTHPRFRVNIHPDFEAERQKLITLVKRFAVEGPNVLTKEAHPLFGEMTVEEWDTLQWKHLDHHLRQFGV